MEFGEARTKLKEEYIKIGFDSIEDGAEGLLFQISGPLAPPVRLIIPKDKIEKYADHINDITYNFNRIEGNCGIVSKDCLEQIIDIKAPGIHGVFTPEDIAVEYVAGERGADDIYVTIGPASDRFIDFIRFDDNYVEKCLSKIHKKILMRNRNGNPIKDMYLSDEAYRPATIKIFNLNAEDIDGAIKKSSDIINAASFSFAKNKRFILNLINGFHMIKTTIDPMGFISIVTGDQIELPSGTFNSDLVRIYQRGVIAEDPFIQFLSFYQILENCFIPNITYMLHKSISQIITSSVTNKIELIVQEVGKNEYKKTDSNMIRQVLEEIISPDELIQFISNYESYLKYNLYTRDTNFLGATSVSLDPDNVRKHIANRIYQIRNALVHFSDSLEGKEKYVPTSSNEMMLKREIPLMQFLAEKIIMKE